MNGTENCASMKYSTLNDKTLCAVGKRHVRFDARLESQKAIANIPRYVANSGCVNRFVEELRRIF